MQNPIFAIKGREQINCMWGRNNLISAFYNGFIINC